MVINPDKWIEKIKDFHRSPGTTEWQNGKTHPELPGWYERYFTDGTFFHWWNGKQWCVGKALAPHWRQVFDYPAWRGLKGPN